MAEVFIPFAKFWQRKMLDKTKTTTWRTQKYGVSRDTFPVFDAKFEILMVLEVPYELVVKVFWATEGTKSEAELREIFRRIWRGREPEEDRFGWLHCFQMIREAPIDANSDPFVPRQKTHCEICGLPRGKCPGVHKTKEIQFPAVSDGLTER